MPYFHNDASPLIRKVNSFSACRLTRCLWFLMAVLPAAWPRSVGDAERAELQIPGRAQPVQGSQQLRNPANRAPLQGNVSPADD